MKKLPFTISVDVALAQTLKELAQKKDITPNALAAQIVEAHLETEKELNETV